LPLWTRLHDLLEDVHHNKRLRLSSSACLEFLLADGNRLLCVEPPRFWVERKVRNRRISPIAVRPGEGLLSDHIAGAQRERRERLFLPPKGTFKVKYLSFV
jgi:hypothetical protein